LISINVLFFQGVSLGIAAGATPGPLQTYLISETLSGGWRRSLPLIFVPVLSDTPIVILTTFILGQMPATMLKLINITGGLFVLYLAWGLWHQWHNDRRNTDRSESEQRNFWKAVATNLLNPNPYIFWTFVSGPILVNAIEQSWWHALLFLLGFYGVFMGTMIALVLLFHQTRRLGPKVVRIIQIISIVILVIFGGILIKEGLIG
jgi:threonine/homoserine/homoserine lactone efflux protein